MAYNSDSIARHTPGPWRVAAPPDKVCTGYDNESDYTKNGWAKTIVNCDHRSWMADGEEFANAALIAAAPELLEALKEAHRALEHYEWYANPRSGWASPENSPLRVKVDAALAKAEGGAPAEDYSHPSAGDRGGDRSENNEGDTLEGRIVREGDPSRGAATSDGGR